MLLVLLVLLWQSSKLTAALQVWGGEGKNSQKEKFREEIQQALPVPGLDG